SWLAQDSDGAPLKPPWSELWTFGSDHLWACRIADCETFLKKCFEWNPKAMRLKRVVENSEVMP
ncbi:MAG: hypothetical protein RQ801_10910, partial [Spirochaetaceae bacterium]|nr:hypothetical protein [Spirochaetaceae bacterium]